MNNYTPFALPCGSSVIDVKQLALDVTMQQWATAYKKHLNRHVDKLSRSNTDHTWSIESILQAAYGSRLGTEIGEKLKPADFETIRNNILKN